MVAMLLDFVRIRIAKARLFVIADSSIVSILVIVLSWREVLVVAHEHLMSLVLRR